MLFARLPANAGAEMAVLVLWLDLIASSVRVQNSDGLNLIIIDLETTNGHINYLSVKWR